jgi:excisionase family DNA binding protein
VEKFFGMVIVDPVGTLILALKYKRPDMTQDQIAMTVKERGFAGFNNRGRASEAVKRFEERFPELAGVMTKDPRGGDRHKRIRNNAELLAESERMRAEEQKKPIAERRPVKGEGSIYQEIAETYKIMGRYGKPSWMVVENRIRSEKKRHELAQCIGVSYATHAQGALSDKTKRYLGGLTAAERSELEGFGLSTDRLLTVHEFAAALQVPVATVLRLVAMGKLPAVRVSPRVLRFEHRAALTFFRQRSTLAT